MTYADASGVGFEVDLPMCHRPLHERAFATERSRRSRIVIDGGQMPGSVRGAHVAGNYRGMREAVRARAARDVAAFERLRLQNGMAAFRMLVEARGHAVAAQNNFRDGPLRSSR